MPDKVMKALARRGGVLGLIPPIQRPPGERPLVRVAKEQADKTLALIRYAVDVMGVNHVGIGTHFNTTVIPWVTDGLLRARYAEGDVASIMGGNYLRVLRQTLPPPMSEMKFQCELDDPHWERLCSSGLSPQISETTGKIPPIQAAFQCRVRVPAQIALGKKIQTPLKPVRSSLATLSPSRV
jgi:hypothetical protein